MESSGFKNILNSHRFRHVSIKRLSLVCSLTTIKIRCHEISVVSALVLNFPPVGWMLLTFTEGLDAFIFFFKQWSKIGPTPATRQNSEKKLTRVSLAYVLH